MIPALTNLDADSAGYTKPAFERSKYPSSKGLFLAGSASHKMPASDPKRPLKMTNRTTTYSEGRRQDLSLASTGRVADLSAGVCSQQNRGFQNTLAP